MKTRRWARPPDIATATLAETQLLLELAPRLHRLAGDSWVLAQRAPTLIADPALVAEANALLPELRRLFRREPGQRLVPERYAPGIGLHALALSLRQLQVAVTGFTTRRRPDAERDAGPDVAEQIDAGNRITALVLRDMMNDLARRRNVPLPPDLRVPARRPNR